jgi:hypothetical protein
MRLVQTAMSKVDNFETMILRYPEEIRSILRDLDEKVRDFGPKRKPSVTVHRYTTSVPDIRYLAMVGGAPKPVFLRVRPRRDKVRIAIETVHDPSGRTEPREKSRKWKKSPRSDRELVVNRMIDESELELLWKSMLSSMTGPDVVR